MLELADEEFERFRTLVQTVREGYRADVEQDAWRSLALDKDAVIAASEALNLGRATDLALGLDFIQGADSPLDENSTLLDDLISAATSYGMKTVGDLESFVDVHLVELASRLQELAAKVTETTGLRPVALPPYVLEIAILLDSDVPTSTVKLGDVINGVIDSMRAEQQVG